jgi:hypothetical protein
VSVRSSPSRFEFCRQVFGWACRHPRRQARLQPLSDDLGDDWLLERVDAIFDDGPVVFRCRAHQHGQYAESSLHVIDVADQRQAGNELLQPGYGQLDREPDHKGREKRPVPGCSLVSDCFDDLLYCCVQGVIKHLDRVGQLCKQAAEEVIG